MRGLAATLPKPEPARSRPASVSDDDISLRSGWPTYAADEIEAACEVLRSGRVNALQHGDQCRAFEQAFAALCDMPHAFSVANGTLALELALRALGIGEGDEVIVPARSFFATASSVSLCGATPVFADIDPDSQNLTAGTIAAAISPRTRAILVVHLAGWPCAMDEISAIAASRGLLIIEDCAQAHGAAYRGRPAGSFGDASAFSFCTDKIISTGGEGGMVLFSDPCAAQRARSFKDHGMDFSAFTPGGGAGFKWLRKTIGSNYRMTEMQAAIGRRQLRKLPDWLRRRRMNADLLNARLIDSSALRLTIPDRHTEHSYYKYYAFVRPERLRSGWTRDRVVAEVNRLGCVCSTGICPEIYLEDAFRGLPGTPRTRLPHARRLGEESLMLQVDPTLPPEKIERMAEILGSVMTQAAR